MQTLYCVAVKPIFYRKVAEVYLYILRPCDIIFHYFSTKTYVVSRASTFTRVNGSVSCLCSKRLQKLPFKRPLACDDLHGLIIASSNEKSVLFSDSGVFDKVSDNTRDDPKVLILA